MTSSDSSGVVVAGAVTGSDTQADMTFRLKQAIANASNRRLEAKLRVVIAGANGRISLRLSALPDRRSRGHEDAVAASFKRADFSPASESNGAAKSSPCSQAGAVRSRELTAACPRSQPEASICEGLPRQSSASRKAYICTKRTRSHIDAVTILYGASGDQ